MRYRDGTWLIKNTFRPADEVQWWRDLPPKPCPREVGRHYWLGAGQVREECMLAQLNYFLLGAGGEPALAFIHTSGSCKGKAWGGGVHVEDPLRISDGEWKALTVGYPCEPVEGRKP
jgi:hypothetical protein